MSAHIEENERAGGDLPEVRFRPQHSVQCAEQIKERLHNI